MAWDHAVVVTAAAQHREEGVSGRTLERASGQAAVSFHVPDHSLDGTSPSQQFCDRLGYAAPRTADKDLHADKDAQTWVDSGSNYVRAFSKAAQATSKARKSKFGRCAASSTKRSVICNLPIAIGRLLTASRGITTAPC